VWLLHEVKNEEIVFSHFDALSSQGWFVQSTRSIFGAKAYNKCIKLTRKKLSFFQSLVVLGKTVHNQNSLASILRSFYASRYTKNRVQNRLQELSLSMFFWTQVICLSVEL
jgi:hypothetical protein